MPDVPREILPIPDRTFPALTTYDARDPDTSFPPLPRLRPPGSAPNVLIVLLDDVGFGASSAFGGPVNMPTAERLAEQGLTYTRFHTTALCSPTRAALLCGRNHHSVGFGSIPELATSAPGYNTMRPNTCAPLGEILRLNGYSTAHVGKCHEVPTWESTPTGPFDRWPSPGNGFEYFYGFLGGEMSQWYPDVYVGTAPVEPWGTPKEGYHLMADLGDKAIQWVRQAKSLQPDQPFFMYFAPGATHTPHHVPKDWADKYKGKFDQGWDALREQTYARQKELGILPPDAELTKRHDDIPAWEAMDDELRPVLAREMEVYAGYLEYADHHVGRLIDAIADLGALEDTLVYYIIGDNGASAEGTLRGTFNGMASVEAPEIESTEFLREHMDELGTPTSYNHYAVGWAHALCTPYQWTKQVASHWGGTRNGTIVHWPKGIAAKGELRHQFCHVIDIAPTVLEVARLPEPTEVHGVMQEPMHGTSMAYTFGDAAAAERHETQYFEMVGNRGIYHKGWSAVTKHRTPWVLGGDQIRFDDDVWELYDGSDDWTQAHDLKNEQPERLHELQRLFLIEAAKHNVLPLDDRLVERLVPAVAGRPSLALGDSQVLYAGMVGLQEDCMLDVKNKSHSVTAEVTVPDGGAHGVILNEGGVTGGWVLYCKSDGRLAYHYSFLGVQRASISSAEAVPEGKHQVRMEFVYDGGGAGKGGDVTLYVDGQQVGNGRVERTHAYHYNISETAGVGRDSGSPVCDDYPVGDNAFSGSIAWIRIDAGQDSHDHLVDPKHLLDLAMNRQ